MTLHVSMVAADRVVWSGKAKEVMARTVEGDLGILSGHSPLMSLLIPGLVRIDSEDGETVRAVVGDGFISVANDQVSIISEDASLPTEIDAAQVRLDLETATANEDDYRAQLAEAKLRLVEIKS
ncbi:MAG: F0F1 ATP synthase subunit epsilon [Actinomycetales bacterium]|nr:F0F1 ATP synthase subunit epsilon [Actinomycetales bacterium]